jgi:hypothetical protein
MKGKGFNFKIPCWRKASRPAFAGGQVTLLAITLPFLVFFIDI